MPARLVDIVEAVFDLLDLLQHWRFWLPVFTAAAVVWIVHETVQDTVLRWILSLLALSFGVVTGIVWQWKKG